MFKPVNLKNLKAKPQAGSKTGYLIRRIIITNFLSIVIIFFTYLWIVYLLSNANSFWAIFRGKDIYVDKDMVPPITPYLNPVPEATKDNSINISGKAESGVKVILNIDGVKSQETTTDSEGEFSFANIAVGLAQQELSVIAEDQAGNKSKDSVHYRIIKDITEPEFTIKTPAKNGETYKSTGRSYRVTGTTEPGITITINDQTAQVLPNGEFSVTIRLEEGDNNLKIKAVDKAGNEKEEEINVKFEKID